MKVIYLLILVASLLLTRTPAPISAASFRPQVTYSLAKNSFGPGGSGRAGLYEQASSIGQAEAGEVSAGVYTLGGGFWGGGVIVPAVSTYLVYLPLVLK